MHRDVLYLIIKQIENKKLRINLELCISKIIEYYVLVSFVDDTIEKNEITIYPNPTNDYVMLRSNSTMEGMHYNITDYMGRVVKQESMISNIEKINLHDIQSGIYFLHIGNAISFPLHIMRD